MNIDTISKLFLYSLIAFTFTLSSCEDDMISQGPAFHSCGVDSVHNPNLTYGIMTDQEGTEYKTIQIGTQVWMAENLRTSTYRNGNLITHLTNQDQWWESVTTETGAWAYPDNDNQFECPYGKLYNGFAVNDPRNVCPSGWHVPTDAEWNTLIGYLDQSFNPNADGGSQSAIAGGFMKNTGTQYWNNQNTNATNECGFSGLPAGTFWKEERAVGYTCGWWSSTEYTGLIVSGEQATWMRAVFRLNGDVVRGAELNRRGVAVRCIKD